MDGALVDGHVTRATGPRPSAPRGSAGWTIAVVNRGDAALRALQAIRDDAFEREVDHRVVALHTTGERTAPWVLGADVAVDLGPAIRVREDGQRAHTYLDHDLLLDVFVAEEVHAAWVGWGLVSESPAFARRCEDAGVLFLGPPSSALEALGDKSRAKALAERLDVPVVPWSGGPVVVGEAATALADQVGYPLLVKATAGGGGRGIRLVTDREDLDSSIVAASREASSSFGDGAVLLERYVGRARHIEVQAAADRDGDVAVLGLRDCTVQRRGQKVVEEAGPGLVPSTTEQLLAEATREMLRTTAYVGLATVEFIVDAATDEPYFMEVNPRLQVEHTVTEESTGLDLVRLQLHLGLGGRFDDLAVAAIHPTQGHAIQARVAAVDPDDGHRPAPGRLVVMRPPSGPGIRVDTGFEEGLDIPSAFDPLVAKVIAYGTDRTQAIARLRRALAEFELVVRGGATNLVELRRLVADPMLHAQAHDVAWLDREVPRARPGHGGGQEHAETVLAVLLAGTAIARRRRADARRAFETTRRLGSLVVEPASPGESVTLEHRGSPVEFRVAQVADEDVVVTTDGGSVWLHLEPINDVRTLVTVDAGRPRVAAVQYVEDTIQVDIDGRTHRYRFDDAGIVRAQAPGVVVAVPVAVGDRVAVGDVLTVVESMKLEMSVVSPVAGTVRAVPSVMGLQVDAGEVLVVVEGDSAGRGGSTATPVSVDLTAVVSDTSPDDAASSPDALTAAGRALRGWDTGEIGSDDARSSPVRLDETPTGRALDVLTRFTELVWLTSRDRGLASDGDGRVASHLELFHTFLRSPDRVDELLPADYRHRLAVVTERFDVDATTTPAALGEQLHRLARAVASLAVVAEVVESLLRTWLGTATSWDEIQRAAPLAVLDDLAAVPDRRLRPVAEFARVLATELAGDGRGLTPGAAPIPAQAARDGLRQWRDFDLEHVAGSDDAHVFLATGRDEVADRRFVTFAAVDDLHPERPSPGVGGSPLPGLEAVLRECFRLHRAAGVGRGERLARLDQVVLDVRPPWTVADDDLTTLLERLADAASGLGLEKILLRVTRPDGLGAPAGDRVLHLGDPSRGAPWFGEMTPSDAPVRALDAAGLRRARLRSRGMHEPSEVVSVLTSPHTTRSRFSHGSFIEHDLVEGRLVPVDRPTGGNDCGVVVGIVANRTRSHPEGMRRVIVLGDPGRGLGSLGEAECARLVAAIDLAVAESLPVEWFAVSAGARVSMDSGTENLDAVARVLRRIIEFTQSGGEVNVVVTGVNVGAQPYFNAEATMLMHTTGILVMLQGTSMVLTGKRALDFAGGVSADDEVAIGGYEQVMGPNGQAQFSAATLEEACRILFAHYDHTYVAPGEVGPRTRASDDPVVRDPTRSPHAAGFGFATVGDVFDDGLNADRKKPFDMRSVMRAVVDADCTPLERWRDMADAEGVLSWEAHLGGIPVALLGLQAHSQPRLGPVPPDGPRAWSGGTLFPASSRKLARALNAASGRVPAVVLASLSGFDGSPESLRELQLEYGAEIGRAVTNFDGRVVFCVVSRYHGGAFVVFSRALNDDMEVLAVEGARASVIGGSAAAAVVFRREVDRRVREHPRVVDARRFDPSGTSIARIEQVVRVEVQEELARAFDRTHSVERAQEVGSVDRIVRPADLRSELISAIARGRGVS